MTLVDKVAKALSGCRAVFPLGDNREQLTEDDAKVLVLTALEAMREPEVLNDPFWAMSVGAATYHGGAEPKKLWEAVIDHAICEHKEAQER